MLLTSYLISSQVKIQLDENFEFVGLNDYDSILKKEIVKYQDDINNIDILISKSDNETEIDSLNKKKYQLESSTLDYEIKNYIQELLLKHYNPNTIELRLHDMGNSTSPYHVNEVQSY